MHRGLTRRSTAASPARVGSSGYGQGRNRRPMLVGAGLATTVLVGLLVVVLERSQGSQHSRHGGRAPLTLRKPERALDVSGAAGGAEQEKLLTQLREKLREAEAQLQEEAARHKVEQNQADQKIQALEKQLQKPQRLEGGDGAHGPLRDTGPYAECEDRLGLGLADRIREKRVTVCSSEGVEAAKALPSSMECYPFRQKHKEGRPSRQWDVFCEATNFFIDFSNVEGDKSTELMSYEWRRGAYHTFRQGSLSATCKPTPAYADVAPKFMPHHAQQMQSFTPGQAPPPEGTYVVQEAPTYLLARDEDCENLFHSMADHMNMYLVLEHVLKMSIEDLAVVLFDRHVDGPYHELIQTAFSPNHPLKRAEDFKGQKVLFKKLIFHLESPAGIVFPAVGNGGELPCYSSSYYHTFRRHVLKAFDLWDVPPPPVPTVVFSVRNRTPQKNLGRILVNEGAVEGVLKEGRMLRYSMVDLATLSFKEQLKIMRNSNIYIGVHGAGLMHAYFLAEEAIVIELHPSYRLDRHFRIATKQSGKIYMPIRMTTAIDCQGSSDNLRVDIDEFRTVLDGAVRIARSFHVGVAECGLSCSPAILALDKSLDPHYGPGVGIAQKGQRLDTRFPC